jgi:hypothetical protein
MSARPFDEPEQLLEAITGFLNDIQPVFTFSASHIPLINSVDPSDRNDGGNEILTTGRLAQVQYLFS